MKIPIIIVNFKTYESATGEKALNLAKICDEVAKETGANIAVAVQPTDLWRISQSVSIPVFAQHIDDIGYGSHTGFLLPQAAKEAGATGTLINHSEHRLRLDQLEHTVRKARQLGLVTVICANNIMQGEAVMELDPDFVAVEPPEMIGGDISVSSANPELVKNAVKKINTYEEEGKIHCSNVVIVGAGVKNGEDVRKSIEFGAVGVLVASGITKAEDPKAALLDMVSGMNG